MCNLDENISKATNQLTAEVERKGEFLEALKREQQCITDLEHLIELGKLDAIGLTKAVLELKKHLLLRREYKDKVDAINIMKSTSLKNFIKFIEGRKTRRYTPRVLTHLGVLGG